MSARTFTSILAAIALAAGAITAISTVAATPAAADSCYTWQRTLKRGHQGSDVEQLQIRVAGWVATDFQVAVDGVFGAKTERAVKRFQRGYGLPVTGRADSATYREIYRLHDADCTPVHLRYSEFNYNCGARNFEGGNVSARQARANTLRVMWQLEALRHKLGDRALVVASGFRGIACNRSVGGSSTSLHTCGKAGDLGLRSGPSQCTIARAARSAGFNEILGPGYPGHNDHVHVGNKSSRFWPDFRRS